MYIVMYEGEARLVPTLCPPQAQRSVSSLACAPTCVWNFLCTIKKTRSRVLIGSLVQRKGHYNFLTILISLFVGPFFTLARRKACSIENRLNPRQGVGRISIGLMIHG